MNNREMPQAEGQELTQKSLYSIDELPPLYVLDGKPPVQLHLQALQEVIPAYMQSQIIINVEMLAKLAHFGGLDNVAIRIDKEKDEIVPVLGNVFGGVGGATGAQVRRKALVVSEVDDDPSGMYVNHSERWGSGKLVITKQQVDDVIEKKGARNAQAVSELLNKKLYQGITQLGLDHLRKMNTRDWVNFYGLHFIGLSGIFFPVPDGGSTEVVIASQRGHILWTLNSPGTLGEVILRAGITYAVLGLGLNLLSRRNEHNQRLSEFAEDPEFLRQAMIKGLQTVSRLRQFRQKYPLVTTGKTN